jgi:hypothetical protein
LMFWKGIRCFSYHFTLTTGPKNTESVTGYSLKLCLENKIIFKFCRVFN